MSEFEFLRQLGMRMGAEPEPKIDVVSRVIGQIAQSRTRIVDPRLSLISVCACGLAAFVFLVTWTAYADNNILSPLSEAASRTTGPEALLRVLEP